MSGNLQFPDMSCRWNPSCPMELQLTCLINGLPLELKLPDMYEGGLSLWTCCYLTCLKGGLHLDLLLPDMSARLNSLRTCCYMTCLVGELDLTHQGPLVT